MEKPPQVDELYGVWQNTVTGDDNRRFTFGRANNGEVPCNRLYDTVHDVGTCALGAGGRFVFTIQGAEDDKETWRYRRSGADLLLNDMKFVAVAGADVEAELAAE